LDKTSQKKKFILSIDGGGMKDLISCVLLERIVEVYPDFIDRVDFLVGCSNGGLVAMELAFGHIPFFSRRLLEGVGQTVLGSFSQKSTTSVLQAKFDSRFIKVFCEEIWHQKKLSDASKKVMIPAVQLDNLNEDPYKREMEICMFHNFTEDEKTKDELVTDVIMRTAAAPTFFKSHQGYIDGGMFAHDPSSMCLIYVQNKLNIPREDIVLLGIGTGWVPHFFESNSEHDWGYYQWIPKVNTVLWDCMVRKSELICAQILEDRFHKLNPFLDKEVPFDDPTLSDVFATIGKNFDLTETIAWIKKNVYNDGKDE